MSGDISGNLRLSTCSNYSMVADVTPEYWLNTYLHSGLGFTTRWLCLFYGSRVLTISLRLSLEHCIILCCCSHLKNLVFDERQQTEHDTKTSNSPRQFGLHINRTGLLLLKHLRFKGNHRRIESPSLLTLSASSIS